MVNMILMLLTQVGGDCKYQGKRVCSGSIVKTFKYSKLVRVCENGVLRYKQSNKVKSTAPRRGPGVKGSQEGVCFTFIATTGQTSYHHSLMGYYEDKCQVRRKYTGILEGSHLFPIPPFYWQLCSSSYTEYNLIFKLRLGAPLGLFDDLSIWRSVRLSSFYVMVSVSPWGSYYLVWLVVQDLYKLISPAKACLIVIIVNSMTYLLLM